MKEQICHRNCENKKMKRGTKRKLEVAPQDLETKESAAEKERKLRTNESLVKQERKKPSLNIFEHRVSTTFLFDA